MSLVCGVVKMSFAPDGASAYRTERESRGRCPSPFFVSILYTPLSGSPK